MDGTLRDIFLKICGAALLFVTVSMVMTALGKGASLPTRLCGPVLLYGGVLLLLLPLLGRLKRLTEGYVLASYGEMMLKALGIAFLSEIVAGICRDGGEGSVASIVEMAGKILILLLCFPLIESLLETVEGLL